MKLSAYIFGLFLTAVCAVAATVEDYAANIAPLIEQKNLSTLGKREANPRVQKVTYWLAIARMNKVSASKVAERAVTLAGYTNSAAELTQAAILRNLEIATKLGCLDSDGLMEMRKGKAATVRQGVYKGQELSVDHIIPRSVVPEIDNVIANLELMPSRTNSKKNDKIAQRQKNLAQKLNKAGLLSVRGLLILMMDGT